MPFTDIWDVTQPPDTQLANLLGQDIRNFKLDTQQRMAAISGISSAKPNFAADAQSANWTGVLFFATDNGHIYQFNGTIWVDITTIFFPSSIPTSFFNADCTVGIVIPANTLKVGSIVEVAVFTNQGIGGASSVLGTNLFGGLPAMYPVNGGSGNINWNTFAKAFVSAIGASGEAGGLITSSNGFIGSVPYQTNSQFGVVATNAPITVKVQLGSGCTTGPIKVVIDI